MISVFVARGTQYLPSIGVRSEEQQQDIMSSTDTLRDSWASLGVAFHSESDHQYSPEEAILLLITSKEFPASVCPSMTIGGRK